MKIKTKLKLIIIATIAVIAGIMCSHLWVKTQTDSLNRMEALVRELNFEVFQSNQIRDEYFIYKTARSKQQWFALNKKITEQFKIMSGLFTGDTEKKDLEHLMSLHKSIADFFNQLITQDQSDNTHIFAYKIRDMIISQMMGESHRLYQQCVVLSGDINRKKEKQMSYYGAFNIITLGLLGLVMALFSKLVIRSVSKPLVRLTEGTKIIAKGEFDCRIDVDSSDEIGDLARGFNLMTEQLASITVSRDELLKEIESRIIIEGRLNAMLKEKEVLLKEIHHRVKNNLQIISSMLQLQSGYFKDEQTLMTFRESQNRIDTMALIHEKLYRSEDLAKINFAEYIEELTTNLMITYGVNPQFIKLKTDIPEIFFDVNTSIPCGLIINELVSNSLKHAFPKGGKGEINIMLQPIEGDKFIFVINDNGVGFPENTDLRNTKSLGLKLITSLTNQLDGTIELIKGKGTTVKITFRELRYKERG